MFPVLPIWLALLLSALFIPLFSFSDREVGDGKEGLVSRVPAMDIAIIGGGILGVLAFGPSFVAVGALWAASRSIGFGDGDLDPSTLKDALQCAKRYVIWLPLSLQAYWRGDDWRLLAGPLAVAIVLIMLMRLHFGAMTRMARAGGYALVGDENAIIERVGGGVFGAALFAYGLLRSGLLHLPG
jgi:hypothetical protein